jgi:hypothetical protein
MTPDWLTMPHGRAGSVCSESSGITAQTAATPHYLNGGRNKQLTVGTGLCRCCTNRPQGSNLRS